MVHLIYVSSATKEMSEQELLVLLEQAQARDRNKRQNVTGMLLYVGGNFIQVLEGDAKDVEEIYDAILNDERNFGNIIIEKEPISSRTFPEWSMGFKPLTLKDKDTLEGYSEFLEREMSPEEFALCSDDVVDLLYQFKQMT